MRRVTGISLSSIRFQFMDLTEGASYALSAARPAPRRCGQSRRGAAKTRCAVPSTRDNLYIDAEPDAACARQIQKTQIKAVAEKRFLGNVRVENVCYKAFNPPATIV